jgi:hypothetical protein
MKLYIKLNFVFFIIFILFQIPILAEENVNKELNEIQTEIINRNEKKYPLTTKLSNSDSGSILSLKNHNVNCLKNSVLNGFHLWGKWGFWSNDVAIEYRCLKNLSIQKRRERRKTNARRFKDPRDSADKLENLVVGCPRGSLISSFLLKERENSIYYEYDCVKAAIKKCSMMVTPSRNIKAGFISKKSISQLDQFHIKAKKGHGLQMFKGEYFGGFFRYVFIDCELR